jgi:hypothetical protein
VGCTSSEPVRVLPSGGGPVSDDASAGDSGDAGGRVRPTTPTAAPPEITGLTPADAPAGGPEVVVAIEGSGFYNDSVVELDGKPLATAYETTARLTATIPASALAKAATLNLVVHSSTSGGRSNPWSFAVLNPTPSVAALSPVSTVAVTSTTGSGLSLTVTGSGFSEAAVVNFGSRALTPTVVGVGSVRVTVPLTALTTAGSVPVSVTNPAPGGGASSSNAFTVTNPNVSLTKCTPTSITVGAGATALTIDGTGFVSGSKVSFNGKDVTTTYGSPTKLTAQLPSTALTTTGSFPVSVTNPAPGGGVSAPLTVTVVNPSPAVSTLAPSSSTVGAGATALKVTGSGFVKGSRVRVDATEATTTYVSATEVAATLSATQLSVAKTIAVTVLNPTPGGGTSSVATFTVGNPLPTIVGLSPSVATAGASETTLTVTGTKFVSTSVVQADATDLPTTFKSSTELSAKLPASKLISVGTISVKVRNPSPGGGTSSGAAFTISAAAAPCDSTGVTYPLASASSVTVPFTFASGPLGPFASQGTSTGTYVCPLSAFDLTAGAQKFGYAVVQNATATPMFLSAEAICTSIDDDSFMAFYRNTKAVPASDAALMACSGYVAEGSGGSGGRTSSLNTGPSSFCPGLTVANGGAIKLESCESLVIVLQPYFYPDLPSPTSVKVSLSK